MHTVIEEGLTAAEQEYVDFIVREYCPYFGGERRELLREEGGLVVHHKDLELAEAEVALIAGMSSLPATVSEPMTRPAPPKRRDDITVHTVHRTNQVMRLFNFACAKYSSLPSP